MAPKIPKKPMDTGTALVLIHEMAVAYRTNAQYVATVPTPEEVQEALDVVEDFIVNNLEEG
jgi:hypothetical protein